MNKTLLILLKMTMRPSKKKTMKTNHPKYAKKLHKKIAQIIVSPNQVSKRNKIKRKNRIRIC